MPVCVPIKEMRDTSRFAELVENSVGPVTVTKNGYGKFVVMRSDDYDELEAQAAKADLMARMAAAERERAEGTSFDALEVIGDLRTKYGL